MKKQQNESVELTKNQSAEWFLEPIFELPKWTYREEIYSNWYDYLLWGYEYSFFLGKKNNLIGARIAKYYNKALYEDKNQDAIKDFKEDIQWKYSLNRNIIVTFNISSTDQVENSIWLYSLLKG